MQTFLPYRDFNKTAQCLDYKRLGKQRVEAWQIYQALTIMNYGWKNHPIVKMWRGYEKCLLVYGMVICVEWINRGYKDAMYLRFFTEYKKRIGEKTIFPSWLDNDKVIISHRSNLLRKNKEYYSKFNWKVKDNIPYYWAI